MSNCTNGDVQGRGVGYEKCWEKESECSWDEVFEKFGWSVTNDTWHEWHVSRMTRVTNVTNPDGLECIYFQLPEKVAYIITKYYWILLLNILFHLYKKDWSRDQIEDTVL